MENKKMLVIVILIFLILIGGIIFGIKSCEPRTKVINNEEEEYSAFINANIEFTCEIIKDSTLAIDAETAENRLNEIYEKWRLPVNDDVRMISILKKYENEAEVISIVRTNTQNCEAGGEPIIYQTAT